MINQVVPIFCISVLLNPIVSAAVTVKKSPYTEVIQALASAPSTKVFPKFAECSEIQVQGYELPEDPYYIGARQRLCIKAPIEQVDEVVSSFESYSELFPDLKAVKILSHQGSEYLLDWKVRVPVFFLPNFSYQMLYTLDQKKDRSVFKYQFVKGETILTSDGVIILEKMSPTETLYTEYDFYSADWGALKSLAPKRIWEDSLQGLIHSDLAIQQKAEKPELSFEEARKGALKKTEALKKAGKIKAMISQKQKFKNIESVRFNENN